MRELQKVILWLYGKRAHSINPSQSIPPQNPSFVAPIIACFLCGERRDPSQLILEPNKIRWGLGQAEAGTGAGLLPLPVIPPTF